MGHFFLLRISRKFPKGVGLNALGKGEGLNCLWKFTGQGTSSHIHSEVFLGNVRCFWDSVRTVVYGATKVHRQRAPDISVSAPYVST